MNQQLAINVISYSPMLVISEHDADVEGVYGAFETFIAVLSQSWQERDKE